ncbi:MAG: DUF167 domain-containing protein [Puniceicoccaceae bacterium]
MTTRLQVRVIPNAGRDEVVGLQDDVLKVKVRAIPEDGRANAALCETLAKAAGCRAREVRIVRGQKSRTKLVELPGEIEFPRC